MNSEVLFLVFKVLLICFSVIQFGLYFSMKSVYFLWAGFFLILLLPCFVPSFFYPSIILYSIHFFVGWHYRFKILSNRHRINFYIFLMLTIIMLIAFRMNEMIIEISSVLLIVLTIWWLNLIKLRQIYDSLEKSRRETMDTTTRLVDYLKKNEKILEGKIQDRTVELQIALQKISEVNNDLIKANHEKNAFLGIVAHDLKNPLASVQMVIIYILKYLNPEEEIENRLNKVLPQIERMFHILKNLLDLNMLETGQFKFHFNKIEPDHMLKVLCEEYKDRFLSKDIQLNLHFEENSELKNIFVDQNFYVEILDNLISNALKYSPMGTSVKIFMEFKNETFKVKVKDSGPGISFEDQKKLFQKFTKLAARPTGNELSSGLGLYIVKILTEGMGGKIHCESVLGSGSTFILEFPIAQ